MVITITPLEYAIQALEKAGGQLGNPNIGDACANACKTISKALRELKKFRNEGAECSTKISTTGF
jgi:hypothetical protein